LWISMVCWSSCGENSATTMVTNCSAAMSSTDTSASRQKHDLGSGSAAVWEKE
jgi:hypothetical protein